MKAAAARGSSSCGSSGTQAVGVSRGTMSGSRGFRGSRDGSRCSRDDSRGLEMAEMAATAEQ